MVRRIRTFPAPCKVPDMILARRGPTFAREANAMRKGLLPVAGCDEAGRGPLAGPVVAAAVILDPARVPKGLDDSKMLDAQEREILFEKICATAEVAVTVAPPARIDRDNILRASLWALAQAVCALPRVPQLVFVDGRDSLSLQCEVKAVIGGDGIVASIAAASIVAKVTRDRLMMQLGLAHPEYGFEKHKGYGTSLHWERLQAHGPTIHHRNSFAPVRACLRGTAAPQADVLAGEV
ncbi:MAG: ribonuclease HII [Xanthobacteraceae bacterium]|nr:ribonuclease HII [Xanthobacteraceae bacterium]